VSVRQAAMRQIPCGAAFRCMRVVRQSIQRADTDLPHFAARYSGCEHSQFLDNEIWSAIMLSIFTIVFDCVIWSS
jgi:hypothetical protein